MTIGNQVPELFLFKVSLSHLLSRPNQRVHITPRFRHKGL